MAISFQDYTATADQVANGFSFSFPYLSDNAGNALIEVYVQGSLLSSSNYTITTSPQKVVISAGNVSVGNSVKVARNSSTVDPLVDFQNGSVLTESELDRSYLHGFYLSQEAAEGSGGELLSKKGGVDYDAEDNKIINLGTPTASTDAADKGYVDQTIDNAIALGGSPAIVSLGGYDVTSTGGTLKQLRAWAADTETNASNISTNTTNISTNASNIATNASNISSNALISAMVSRPTMQYRDFRSVYFKGLKEVSMCGFRFQGLYEKQAGKKFSISGDYPYASLATDLEYESSNKTREWYAVFAVADDGDANAVFKIVPFLQVNSVSGNVVTLNEVLGVDPDTTGHRVLASATYNWSDDALNGAECLIITEKIDDRVNSWSGRKTTITDSTNSTVTLNSAGTLGQFDWILPAPKSKSNYVYLGSFYIDRAEMFNFADGNGIVSQDNISLQTAHSFDMDAIATAQTPTLPGNLTLDGAATSGGTWHGEAGHLIHFSTVANESARTVTISGTVEGVGPDTEIVTLGTGTSGAISTKRWLKITSIAIDGATTNTMWVGLNAQDSIDGQLVSSHPGVPLVFSGIVSPLATGVKMQLGFSSGGSSLGEEAIKICHDASNHIISQQQIDRESDLTAFNRIQANEILTFSFFQILYIYSSSGGINDVNMTRKVHINGYYEP